MSRSTVGQDPGIQVVAGEIDPEVDARGIQHQPFDRNALLESREAHFQANFQPDRPNDNPALASRQQNNPDERTRTSRWSRLTTWGRRNKGRRKTNPWLLIALAVTSCLAITTTVLAAIYARRRYA